MTTDPRRQDTCPFIPDGASDLEDALITRAWRDAVDMYAQLARHAGHAAEMLLDGQDTRIQDLGGMAATASRATAAESAMVATVEATRRRLGHKKHPFTGVWTLPEQPATATTCPHACCPGTGEHAHRLPPADCIACTLIDMGVAPDDAQQAQQAVRSAAGETDPTS